VTAVWWLCAALMAAALVLCGWQYFYFVHGAAASQLAGVPPGREEAGDLSNPLIQQE